MSALERIFDCYSTRSKSLWAREPVVNWVHSVLKQTLSSDDRLGSDTYIEEIALSIAELESRPGIRRYLAADTDDFKEDYPRLPEEANPFDRDLVQPNLLGEAGARNMFVKDAYLDGGG